MLCGLLVGIGAGVVLGSAIDAVALGALLGAAAGYSLGAIPGHLALRSLSRKLSHTPIGELQALVGGLAPNLALLELRRRGEDIAPYLTQIVGLLVAPSVPQRGRGWAALQSAWPDLAQLAVDYDIADSPTECERKLEPLYHHLRIDLGAAVSGEVPAGGVGPHQLIEIDRR